MTKQPTTIMSIMQSELLREKLLERRAIAFAKSILGVKKSSVERIGRDDFIQHRSLLAKHANLDSLPVKKWDLDTYEEHEVANWFASRLAQVIEDAYYVPFEVPFIVRVEVEDALEFINSLWSIHGTHDMTIFIKEPIWVIDLQEREDGIYYFEA
ncbi:hypothetical protein [Noviherbaspirillum aerium]|uniref:hypothetical protein n=1 Tax=Noviherbaspirillum aerium TaxID=2588497 RepID=UPI00124DF319|nr:hypothetical protein [Noviherbaspirillum aerium]